ncbi:hypothetical protein W97_05591 [Coniosporium apollinis CBS 100218]|uniref:Uncharacterized protein n=1 Tax=Coniosporium apollinis (strain CBS 100218) TaxID=1168221 RepID=R7YWI4_CONA1|nr:uncharacterized protein W97_05591 [Coniosporium apollinis CBS 100218]EON66198.1 hypothetical protein W97_05591 [Coniosporium apollinis CBS 100218]
MAGSSHQQYPFLSSLLVRIALLLSSGILVFDIYYMFDKVEVEGNGSGHRLFPMFDNNFAVREVDAPWFWLALHIAGHLSVGVVLIHIVLHWFQWLHPLLDLILHLFNLCLWIAGMIGISYDTIDRKLMSTCGTVALCKLLMTILAIILDLIAWRRESRGSYSKVQVSAKKTADPESTPLTAESIAMSDFFSHSRPASVTPKASRTASPDRGLQLPDHAAYHSASSSHTASPERGLKLPGPAAYHSASSSRTASPEKRLEPPRQAHYQNEAEFSNEADVADDAELLAEMQRDVDEYSPSHRSRDMF